MSGKGEASGRGEVRRGWGGGGVRRVWGGGVRRVGFCCTWAKISHIRVEWGGEALCDNGLLGEERGESSCLTVCEIYNYHHIY